MAKSAEEIIKIQLGELTFQLCVIDADRMKLREENEALKEEVKMLRRDIKASEKIGRPESGQMEAKANGY